MKHPSIHTKEPFQQNIVRLIHFYNQLAIEYLQKQSNVHENIHQTRLCFKRIRSFLRLGRSGLGEQFYRHYNAFYRDLSRSLSQLRDFTALIETLPAFIKTRRTQASKAFLTSLRNHLLIQRKQQLDDIIAGNTKADVIRALQNKGGEISKWDFAADAREVFTSGAARIFRRGKRLFLLAQSNPDDHNMHEWRKQVKYFWYHLLVLTPVWPEMMSAWAKEVQMLSQLLGKHHDLVLLENMIDAMEKEPELISLIKSLKQSIRMRKLQFERRCLELGAKVYAEGPASVGERLKAYWA